MYSTLSQFPQQCLWNGSCVRLIDDGPLSSFQGRSSSTSSFHASLLQVIDGVTSLALCSQVVSPASQYLRSMPFLRVALPTSLFVMSLALCPQVVSQSPQYFRSSENQATCEGCFAHQSICLVVPFHYGMSRTVHLQEFLKVDVDHRHIPLWACEEVSSAVLSCSGRAWGPWGTVSG